MLRADVTRMIEWLTQLQTVEADREPLFVPTSDLTQRREDLREDVVTAGGHAKVLLENAVNKHRGFFAVPRVVTKGGLVDEQ